MKVRRTPYILLLSILLLSIPTALLAQISIGIAINTAPPPLPVYDQPFCPGPNYIWTPGYWAWDGYDYYWVPGTWVVAPAEGMLWTPGWWGWGPDGYMWHTGYWGPHIGFYGGVNYGFGYYGSGYEGGYWHGHDFYYNSAVSHVNTTVIRNVYINQTVVNNVTINRVSYNGGQGGVVARASSQEQFAERERHIGPVREQLTHHDIARQDQANFFKNNHGAPAVAAVARPVASVNDMHRNAIAARPVEMHPVPQPQQRPQPQMQRPEFNNAQPQARPIPQEQNHYSAPPQHTQPQTWQPAAQPQPQQRPQPQMQRPEFNNAQPQARPMPQEQNRYSAPPQRTPPQTWQPAAQPQPQQRPQPQMRQPEFNNAQPQARPMPQEQNHYAAPPQRTPPEPQPRHESAPPRPSEPHR